ncbi:putative xylanase [Cellulophaga algicola DSM 14237]|uniref:Xylanase n=1 Tax=Cellulophaga algicola (strain DSM 14237 / IC166 / ACAM 630) TaxID=688270 RepID=E6X428_CELAD|nr:MULTISPECIES: alpha/beta hydrolase [Cellulophaga]ADV50370.1 putative xylanase [Cellulophaga algicola DSM 14237]
MNKNKVFFLLLLFMYMLGNAQDTILPIWTKEIPNRIATDEKEVEDSEEILRISLVQKPIIEVFLPAKRSATGKAVLIFPGGGYHFLAYDWEGTDVAKFLNAKGIAAIVVKSRLPNSKSLTEAYKVPLQDAQRAMRITRENASTWHINPNEIGIIGFSAGGHLASTLGTHYDEIVYEKQDPVDELSARPDFMALIYPVITMKEQTHQGSKNALLGKKPSDDQVEAFSNETQVTTHTPPTFLVHATDDTVVPVENSLLFYTALKAHKVPVTLFVYPKGGHGFGLGLHDEFLKDWPNQLMTWMATLK